MEEISYILNRSKKIRIILALVFFLIFIIGGLIHVGDYSVPAIINRICTATVQIIMWYVLGVVGVIIYSVEKDNFKNGNNELR